MGKEDDCSERNKTMNSKLFSDLYSASEYYRVCNTYHEKIANSKTNIQNCKNNYIELKGKKKNPSVANIFLVMFGVVTCLTFLPDAEIRPAGILIAIAIALVVIFNILRCKSYNDKHSKQADKLWYDKWGPAIAQAEKDIQKANQRLMKYKADHYNCINFLPNQYQNYSATSYMAIAVRNGRADTFKEAANLYEEQLHRWRMEQINEEIAAQNWAIQNNLASLGQQQAETNKLLKDIENLEFYNAFVKNN